MSAHGACATARGSAHRTRHGRSAVDAFVSACLQAGETALMNAMEEGHTEVAISLRVRIAPLPLHALLRPWWLAAW
jgi:hypothetical protein